MTGDKGREGGDDWSASFVRVRTEMSVTTVILVSVVWLDMNLSKIPGFGVELSHQAPKGWIILFLLLFFFYFAFSLVIKFWRENAHIKEPRSSLIAYEETLRKQIERLMAFSQPDYAAELKQYTDAIGKAYEEYNKHSVTKFEQLTNWQKERWNRSDLSSFSYAREENDIRST